MSGTNKYIDFVNDARVAVNNMIVMLYDGEDRVKVKESPYLEYGLSEFKYSFDLKATYEYFSNEYLIAASRQARNTLITDLKLYANNFRKFTDKWFATFTEGLLGGETNDFTTPDSVLKTVCIENISTLTQLADKIVFTYVILNSYPVNTDDEIDLNNAVRYTHSGLSEPSRETLYPIPISVLKFISMVDYFRDNFNSIYAWYRARYTTAFKTVAANFAL
jgi:hypothetical protein